MKKTGFSTNQATQHSSGNSKRWLAGLAIILVELSGNVVLSALAQTSTQPAHTKQGHTKQAKTSGSTMPQKSSLAPAYNAYIGALRAKVDNNWYLADGRNKVIIALHVAPDGSVTDLDITSTPKNSEAEQAASDAFNKAQPLPALPAGSPPVKLTLTFTSTADPHGDNDRDISGLIEPVAQPAKEAASSDSSSASSDSNGNTQDANGK